MLPILFIRPAQSKARTFFAIAMRSLAGLAIATTLSACSTVGYYAQALGGHVDLWRKQIAIDSLLSQPGLSAETREKLVLVQHARQFAFDRLGLPDNGSYRKYVELDRPSVVWNVFVAPPLALTANASCFPLLGCVVYRGYFQREAAERYAAQQRALGNDVFVGGVAAYSTLGWFADPVLSTFVHWSDSRLIDILFHELSHQLLYIADDSAFNEGFAMAVAQHGLSVWRGLNGPIAGDTPEYERRERQLMALVLGARNELAAVYDVDSSRADLLARKAEVFAVLQTRYIDLKNAWGGYSGFDKWIAEDWNNARMLSIATYHHLVPAFSAVLKAYAGNLPGAYERISAISELEPPLREQCLAQYLAPQKNHMCDGLDAVP